MQSLAMDNFQDKSENSLLDLSFESIGTTVKTNSILDSNFADAEKLEATTTVVPSSFPSELDLDPKAKDSEIFDECIPIVQSSVSREGQNKEDEPFAVLDKIPVEPAVDAFKNSHNEKDDDDDDDEDVVESDYMNPYVSIRHDKEKSAVTPEPATESAAAAAAAPVSVPTTFTSVAPSEEPLPTAEVEKPAAAPSIPSTNTVVTPAVADAPAPPAAKECIEIEQMFKDYGLDAWFNPAKLHPKVESLIYWRDVKKSGVVFGGGLALLLAMSLFSLISVFSYLSLLLLFGTISFRIYKNVLQAVQKTAEGHPFKEYLDMDLTLSQEKVQQLATVAVAHVNALLTGLRRLFLVEDLVDSIKFGVLLYWLTYVGAIFNGITCVMIGFVALFTLPKVYENNKQSVDTHIELVRSKIQEITEKVKAAVPLGKKTETEKTK
ncbi:reticulon-3 isoform X1 [Anopheles aquasalis]|uniref:reticulon-3 isoform X1 n=1 Tax=Anopheles aquasalis TaxID=42839 RepID=UPI00215B0895|nr:reticulon-3 isoform X1 [Anopheles aquasalis]